MGSQPQKTTEKDCQTPAIRAKYPNGECPDDQKIKCHGPDYGHHHPTDDCSKPEIRAQFPNGNCSEAQKQKCHGHDYVIKVSKG